MKWYVSCLSSAFTTFLRFAPVEFCFRLLAGETGDFAAFLFFSFSRALFAIAYSEARMSAGLLRLVGWEDTLTRGEGLPTLLENSVPT